MSAPLFVVRLRQGSDAVGAALVYSTEMSSTVKMRAA